MSESEFLTIKQAEEWVEKLQNSASVADQDNFIPIDFSDTLTENITMQSPFYDFLVSKGRVFPTNSAEGAFRNIEIPMNARSKFSANETASDINNTDVSFTAPKYSTAVVARKIESTDMFQTGNPDFDSMEYLRESATQDNYTAIDEGLFNNHIPNKFDGIGETTENIIDCAGDPVTLPDVQKAVRKVMDRGGVVDGVIATGGAIEQLVASDDKNNQKVYPNGNNGQVILGKWSSQIMTASGMVPLIADPNINNRGNVEPEPLSDAVYVLDSRSVEIAVLSESMSKKLGASSFAESELVGTFLRMGNLAPYRNAKIANIGVDG